METLVELTTHPSLRARWPAISTLLLAVQIMRRLYAISDKKNIVALHGSCHFDVLRCFERQREGIASTEPAATRAEIDLFGKWDGRWQGLPSHDQLNNDWISVLIDIVLVIALRSVASVLGVMVFLPGADVKTSSRVRYALAFGRLFTMRARPASRRASPSPAYPARSSPADPSWSSPALPSESAPTRTAAERSPRSPPCRPR